MQDLRLTKAHIYSLFTHNLCLQQGLQKTLLRILQKIIFGREMDELVQIGLSELALEGAQGI